MITLHVPGEGIIVMIQGYISAVKNILICVQNAPLKTAQAVTPNIIFKGEDVIIAALFVLNAKMQIIVKNVCRIIS